MEKSIASPPLPDFYTTSQASSSSSANGFLALLTRNPIASSISDVYSVFSERRAALGLPFPGTVENVASEVQRDVFLSNYMFSGLRAELTKIHSSQPLFRTAHNMTMGAQGIPPYSFAALYGSPNVFLQGNIDNDLQLSARANYRWTSSMVTKSSVQLAPGAGQSMVQLETEYNGADFSLDVKAMNPSILDGALTGVFVGDYMQAITPNLSLGIEGMYQRSSAGEAPQTVFAYAARYKTPDWIASGQLLAGGAVNTSYWRRLSDRVEAGVDLNLQFVGLSGASMLGAPENDATATIGAKYDFRTSVFRGQADSKGKVGAYLEKNMSETVQVTFAAEIDHPKNNAKLGVAVSLNSADEAVMEKQRQGDVNMASPPF